MEPATAAPIRRIESHDVSGDGLTLFRRSWVPADPRRALLMVHGYAEHCGRYEAPATWFAERGFAVHAYDHRGHGRSEGTRTHVGSFDEYLDDLDQMLDWVQCEHPGVPVTLVGHSMGGLVTLTYLVERSPVVSSAVTSGAAVVVGAGVSATRRRLAAFFARVLPKLSMGSGLDLEGLSRDPEVVARYQADPLVSRTMTASLGSALLETGPATLARASEVAVPLLMLHGEDDPLCSAEGSRRFHERVTSAGSQLRLYAGLRHEIFNEPERESVYQDIQDWLAEIAD